MLGVVYVAMLGIIVDLSLEHCLTLFISFNLYCTSSRLLSHSLRFVAPTAYPLRLSGSSIRSAHAYSTRTFAVNMPTTLKDFESVFPRLVEDLTQQCQQYGLPKNALEWYQKVAFQPFH